MRRVGCAKSDVRGGMRSDMRGVRCAERESERPRPSHPAITSGDFRLRINPSNNYILGGPGHLHNVPRSPFSRRLYPDILHVAPTGEY